MSVRITVRLDDDVFARVKRESQTRGASLRDTLNDLLRTALLKSESEARRHNFRVKPFHMGYRPELNYDNIEALISYAEGEDHK